MFDLIAFDADDTLWENNLLYLQARDRYIQILAKYALAVSIEDRLEETEVGNLGYYGYGVMSFVLSLVEAAIEMTGGRVSAEDIAAILAIGKEMITTEVRLYANVEATLREISGRYRLILITKGDLAHQQSKVAQSGLSQYFQEVVVVAVKNREIYTGILEKQGVSPERFLMVGDSIRSDMQPVLELGGWGVFVPNENTWTHEKSAPPQGYPDRFFELDHLGLLPALLQRIEGK